MSKINDWIFDEMEKSGLFDRVGVTEEEKQEAIEDAQEMMEAKAEAMRDEMREDGMLEGYQTAGTPLLNIHRRFYDIFTKK